MVAKKPRLSQHTGRGDPWADPVYCHNAEVIQAELRKLFERAKKGGVFIEFHRVEHDETVEAVGLELPSNHPEKPDGDGVYIFASPDIDLTPEVVL